MKYTDDFNYPNPTVHKLATEQRLPLDLIKLKYAHVTKA